MAIGDNFVILLTSKVMTISQFYYISDYVITLSPVFTILVR